jgi:serine/threonine-protein kinase RsbW
LGEAPRNFIARHMQLTTTTQRQSCMLYFKRLKRRERRTIYAPPRHRAMIAAIYEELGLPVVMSYGTPPKGRGSFHEGITRSDAIGTIEIEAVGEETSVLVRQAADDLRATSHIGALYALLPLEDPGTPALCDAMEDYGFFFSGVGPWMLGGKDALRLQMPLTPIDLSALVVIGDFGKRLLDYIASERDRARS